MFEKNENWQKEAEICPFFKKKQSTKPEKDNFIVNEVWWMKKSNFKIEEEQLILLNRLKRDLENGNVWETKLLASILDYFRQKFAPFC